MHQFAPGELVAVSFRAGGLWAREGRGGDWINPPGHSPDFCTGLLGVVGAVFAPERGG